jgi:prepilin-type N-terminal cleavage/methylation domain-containing protein
MAYGEKMRKSKAGFTLVEVIVVIVIIAILAAIGVPALTGYIDKANDKQWIAKARNAFIATRTVIDELYADGRLDAKALKSNVLESEIDNPDLSWNPTDIAIMSDNFADDYEITDKVSALVGDNFSYQNHPWSNGLFHLIIVGPTGSTLLNAEGFLFEIYPGETAASGEPVICVTYKMDRIDTTGINTYYNLYDTFDFAEKTFYNPNAGYEVYYLVK